MVEPLRRAEIGWVESEGSSLPEVVVSRRERVFGRKRQSAMWLWRDRMEAVGGSEIEREGSPGKLVMKALIIVN